MKASRTKRIAIDAYYVTGRLRGMARYARMLIQSLPEDRRELLPKRPTRGILHTITSDQKWFPLWEQAVLPYKARAAGTDFILCPYNTGPLWSLSRRVIVVIHDLIFLDEQLGASPSTIQNLGRKYRAFVAKRVARSSHLIVTCSEFSKSRIVSLLGVPESKIVVIPNVVENDWFSLQPHPDLKAPYVFAIAGEAPSKNTTRLIEAMGTVSKKAPLLTLKIAGINPRFHTSFLEVAKEYGLENKVELLSYIEDEALRHTYSRAAAFVCPSLAEGFGIPLLEAMASGIPVASSHATSLPEVAGDCAVYFDPLDPKAMAQAIETALDGSAVTQRRAAAGRERAALFTPSALQPMLQQFWHEILGIG